MAERVHEEESVRQSDDGTHHIGSVAGSDVEVPDHVWRALHSPGPVIRQVGEDREPPLVIMHMPPVYPGGWRPKAS